MSRIPSYEPGSKLVVLGMAIPPLRGNPYNGYINPYYWVDEFTPYYTKIMGVDRPDRTYLIQKILPDTSDTLPQTNSKFAPENRCCKNIFESTYPP